MTQQKPKRSFDWEVLKAEYVNGDWTTLNQFRESKGIDKASFYRAIEIEEWYQAKQKLADKTLNKIIEKKSQDMAKKWSQYGQIWDALKSETIAVIKQTLSHDGKGIVAPLSPADIDRLSASIDRIFKNERLHYGQTTEKIGTENLHLEVVKIIEGVEDEPTPL